MPGHELVYAVIVVVYLAGVLRSEQRRGLLLARFVALAVASFVGEETMIHLYGFYAYTPEAWTIFVDEMPLLVPLIWPVVIHSADALARAIVGDHARRAWLVPALGAAIVLVDACLIEPIAVAAGLWAWTAPGFFGVPPIGVIGWAVFAFFALAVFERTERAWPIVVIAPAATHPVLIALWWGALRWGSGEIPDVAAAAGAAAALVVVAVVVVATGAFRRVPAGLLLARVPAAGVFFVLLALHGRDRPWLIAWALAFPPPYLALLLPFGARREEGAPASTATDARFPEPDGAARPTAVVR